LAIEALFLFVFSWIAVLVASVLRPGPMDSLANAGIWRFLKSTLLTGLEVFVFGYVLSRFFKQFKTGCAFVIIVFFAYLLWAGRHP
jgi:ABC-type transport system involved in multi-copper enzyme maturation permease subunit